MNRQGLEELLTRVQRGDETVAGALARLRDLPGYGLGSADLDDLGCGFADLGFAKPDLPSIGYGASVAASRINRR